MAELKDTNIDGALEVSQDVNFKKCLNVEDTITASAFNGSLYGDATFAASAGLASRATGDADGNPIKTTYFKSTGGTLTISAYNGLIIKRKDENGASILFKNSAKDLGKIGFSLGNLVITSGDGTDGVADMLKITPEGLATFYGTVSVNGKGTVATSSDSTATNIQAMSTSDFDSKKASLPDGSLVAVW